MRIYPKKIKQHRGKGHFYFGDYGEIPLEISYATVENIDEIIDKKMHFHKKANEFYVTLKGKGILELGDQHIILEPSHVVMVEPLEPHRVLKALEVPFVYIVLQDMKYQFDKVLVDEE